MSETQTEQDSNISDDSLSRIVEALLFVSDEPLSADRLAAAIESVRGADDATSAREIERLVGVLNEEYVESGRSFRVHNWAGGFRLATQPEYAAFVRSLLERTERKKLSRTIVETLAIVAYQQPVTKPGVDYVRGVDSDYAIRRLLEFGLVDVVGRSEGIGRPLLYGTTADFLDRFGLSRVEDLPNLEEIEELLADPAFDRERAALLMQAGLSDRLAAAGDDAESEQEESEADRAINTPGSNGTTTNGEARSE